MADDGKVGELWVGVGMDLKPMKRQAGTELKKVAEEIGKEAAEAITEAMAFPITTPFPLGKALKKQAVASLQEVMGDLKKVADEKMAELREALSMGLINRSEFNRRGKEVAEAFSQGLDAKIQELGMQDRVSPALMQQVENVKQTGIDIGYQAGESIMAGLRRASDLQMADAKEAFARGLIDQEEFDKRGREAGQTFNNAVLAEIRKRAMEGTLSEDQFLFLTKHLKTAGIKGGDEFLAGVQHSTRIKMAKAKDALLRGLIDHKEFEKRGREAAEAANKAILDEIRKRVAAGTLKSKDFLALSDALKDTGARGGKQFGQEATKGAKGALGDLNKWLAGGFVVGALMAFTGLANRVIRMFQRVATGIRDTLESGGAARTVRSSFEAVAGSRGADPTSMLGDLRQAVRGTTTDLDLMRRATFALNAGLPATGQQMGELATIARRLGAAVGKDAASSFQQLAEGIAKGRSQTLQELGIMTRRNDALRAWEKQTGRNSAALSEQEKVLIHLGAVLVEGRAKVAAMGDEAGEAATPVQQLGTFLANLRDRTAEAVANSGPVVGMLTEIGDAAGNSSDKVQQLATNVGAYVAATVAMSRKYGEGPARGVASVAGFLGRQFLGINEFSEFGRLFKGFQRAGEIETETDITKLKGMQVENLERMVELQGKSGKAAEEERKSLEQQNEAIKARVALLTPKPVAGGQVGPTGPTEDQIKEADKALKGITTSMREFQAASVMGVSPLRDAPDYVQAAVRELVKAQEALRQTDEYIAAIRAGGKDLPEGVEAYREELVSTRDALRELAEEEIAVWRTQLPLILSGVEKSISKLPTAIIRVQGEYLAMADAMDLARKRTESITKAEEELRRARIAGDPARIAAAEKRLADQRKALREYAAKLVKALRDAGVPAEKLNHLTDLLGDHLETAGINVEQVKGKMADIVKFASSFASTARGVMSIADAMGILDERQRSVLQGSVDLADGLAKVAASGGKDVGGWVQSIGALVKMLSSGGNKMPIIESQANLIRALDRLRGAVLQDITAAEKERLTTQGGAILGGFEAMAKHLGDRFTVDKISPEALNVIKDIEARTGTSIISDGKVDMEAFRAAMKALEEMDLAVFGHDLQGKLDGLGWVFRMIGDEAGDATERLARFLSVVSDFSPEFASELQRIYDEEGAEAANAWIQTLAEEFGLHGMDSPVIRAIFGDDVTARDVQRIIEEGLSFVGDAGAGVVASGRPETRMAVNLTQTQGDELLRIGSTQLYHLAGIHSLIAQMVSAPPPVYGAMPDISPPSPASLGLGSQTINVGGITIQLALSAAESVTPGNAYETGERIGAGVDAGVRAAYRGAGTNGPTRFKVEVT